MDRLEVLCMHMLCQQVVSRSAIAEFYIFSKALLCWCNGSVYGPSCWLAETSSGLLLDPGLVLLHHTLVVIRLLVR